MFSSTLQKIVCVLVILSVAVVAHSQTAQTKEATGVVSGKVTIKGKAAAGIVILLRANSLNTPLVSSYKATTDLNGEYRIANVQPGNYTIATLAPLFVDGSALGPLRTLFVNKGETIEHIDFTLVRGGVITGKIVDADGRPVVEQPVVVFASDNNQNVSNATMLTDDRGIYRFYGLKAGSYKVSTGQGERGSFSNRPARYKQTFYPAAVDMDQAAIVEVSEGGETANIDITVGPSLSTYTASGKIVDGETGQPLAGVAYGVMRFISPYNTSSSSNGAVSNSRGEFKLQNLTPGKYAVQINPTPTNTWRADDVRFEIVDDDVTGLVVQTRKGATLSGVVILEGEDDKNARKELQRMSLVAFSRTREVRPSSAWSTIGADGSFTMSGVASGPSIFQIANSSRFRIIRVERNGVVQAPGIEVKEGEEISGLRIFVAYGNATIRGAVEVANGTVPAGARFSVWVRNLSEEAENAPSNYSVDVDARGQFVIEGVFPGMYEITAGIWNADGHTNFAPKKQQIAVTAGSVSNITLSVEANTKTTRP